MIRRRSFVESLSIFAFAILGLSLVQDAFGAITCRSSTGQRACSTGFSCPAGWQKISNSCSTQTVGGSITYISHHGIAIKCTWTEFQGEWSAEPGTTAFPFTPISVTQRVGQPGDPSVFATCSGWPQAGGVPTPPLPFPFTSGDHDSAPYGKGKFWFSVKYESTAPLDCEDANSGIGNNCGTFTDLQNKKHQPTGIVLTGAAERSCTNTSPGTELTYTFKCADGVKVEGHMILLTGESNPSGEAGSFTNCSQERIDAGACTMQLGGLPGKYVTKGKNTTFVLDRAACEAAFPGGVQVPNALDSGQSQPMGLGQLLIYTEKSKTGYCDPLTGLPTDTGLPPPPDEYLVGTPTAAYARYCQSDIGPFSDNLPDNMFSDLAGEGFDNELRFCGTTKTSNQLHTAAQDVEGLKLGDGTNDILLTANQSSINAKCQGNESNDSGKLDILIPNQESLLVTSGGITNIDITPLSDAPKLEGVSPIATAFTLMPDGITPALKLTYYRCPELAAAIHDKYPGDVQPPSVMLTFSGKTESATSLGLNFSNLINYAIPGGGW